MVKTSFIQNMETEDTNSAKESKDSSINRERSRAYHRTDHHLNIICSPFERKLSDAALKHSIPPLSERRRATKHSYYFFLFRIPARVTLVALPSEVSKVDTAADFFAVDFLLLPEDEADCFFSST